MITMSRVDFLFQPFFRPLLLQSIVNFQMRGKCEVGQYSRLFPRSFGRSVDRRRKQAHSSYTHSLACRRRSQSVGRCVCRFTIAPLWTRVAVRRIRRRPPTSSTAFGAFFWVTSSASSSASPPSLFFFPLPRTQSDYASSSSASTRSLSLSLAPLLQAPSAFRAATLRSSTNAPCGAADKSTNDNGERRRRKRWGKRKKKGALSNRRSLSQAGTRLLSLLALCSPRWREKEASFSILPWEWERERRRPAFSFPPISPHGQTDFPSKVSWGEKGRHPSRSCPILPDERKCTSYTFRN